MLDKALHDVLLMVAHRLTLWLLIPSGAFGPSMVEHVLWRIAPEMLHRDRRLRVEQIRQWLDAMPEIERINDLLCRLKQPAPRLRSPVQETG